MPYISTVYGYTSNSTLIEFRSETKFAVTGKDTYKEQCKGGGSRVCHYHHFPNLQFETFLELGYLSLKEQAYTELKPSQIDKSQLVDRTGIDPEKLNQWKLQTRI